MADAIINARVINGVTVSSTLTPTTTRTATVNTVANNTTATVSGVAVGTEAVVVSGGAGPQGPPGADGPQGPAGATGATGAAGANGQGVPTGGTTGQTLRKASNTNYDTGWETVDADDIDDTSTTHKFVTSADVTKLSNLSGTNTGDQDLSPYFNKSADDLDDITAGTTNKHFTATDETKLDGIETAATANPDAVDGPASSVDNTIPRYHLTTGKIIQGSGVTISDTNDIDTAGTIESTTAMGAPIGVFNNITEYTTAAGVTVDDQLILGEELDANGKNIIDLADVTFKTGAIGGTLRTGTSNADKFELQAYDVNGGFYQKVLEADAGNTPTLEVFADSFGIWDNADESKRIRFLLSGATTGTTTTIVDVSTTNKSITLPDATDTLVGKATTDTLTNKTLTSPKLNENVAVTATATEVNILDGATLSTTELNYVDGVTGAIQGQIDAKPTISSGAGAPGSTPGKVGDIYIDTTGDDAYIAVGTASSADWEKSNDDTGAGGGMTSLTLAGDAGTPQTLTDGNTATVAGGTGIDTSAGATDTVTVSLDAATQASLASADSALQNVVEDTSPQLGGQLDAQGENIIDVASLSFTGTTPTLKDSLGASFFGLSGTVASAVNYPSVNNSVTGNPVQINASGSDTNININLNPKGSGTVTVGGQEVANTTNTITMTNKRLTSPKINEAVNLTATSTELNILDGATLSTAELNILDGVTATTAELNYTDGVTSAIQTQIDGKQPLDSDLTTIAGLTPTTDNFIQSKAGAWSSRTIAQVAADILAVAYPVGAIYVSTLSTNPATLLGFGTWAAFGTGRMMIGIDAGDAKFDTVEETGGAETVTLTTTELPAHTHGAVTHTADTGAGTTSLLRANVASGDTTTTSSPIASEGSGAAFSIMNPYIVVYQWKRTA